MNSVMTAGLHHRWRERAADLARRRPGDRALDVATGTGDLAIELARRVAPGGEVIGSDFSEGMLERARTKAPRADAGSGPTRSSCPYADDASTPRPSASARATSPTSTAGWREMARVVRPGGRVVVLEITTPQKPPLSTFFSIWFDRVVPAARALAGDPRPTRTCRARSSASRARRRSAGGSPRAGLRRRALDPHRGRDHRPAPRDGAVSSAEAVAALVEAGGAHVPGADGAARGAPRRARRLARRGARRARRRDDPRRRQAAAAAARVPRRRARRGAGHDGVLRAAVAVELIHSATLVHDDVLDAAPLRRGRPTVVATAGPRDRHRDRRPAVLARVRRAGGQRARRTRCACSPTPRRRSPQGELLQREDAWNVRRDARALPARAATSRPRGCSRPRAGWARSRAAAPAELLGDFGRRIGLAFQLLDDVLDVSGPAERTGKHRGTDLLDGTVTLPLILARERDPELAALDLRAVRTPEQAEAVCDAIAATGALEAARAEALAMVARRRRRTCRRCPSAQRAALELVADGGRRPLQLAPRSPSARWRRRRARRRSARSRPPCWPA